MAIEDVIPSMFLRRLMLIGAGVVGGFGVLGLQSARLTLGEGRGMLDRAEQRLVSRSWTGTVRGQILDRKGRILAQDMPAFDVMVEYRVLTGEADYNKAARLAREAHSEQWVQVDRAQRERWIEQVLADVVTPEREEMWQDLARVTGQSQEELSQQRDRIVRMVERRAGSIWNRWYEKRSAELGRERATQLELELPDVAKPIAEQTIAHAVVVGVPQRVKFEVAQLASVYDGLTVERSAQREYPYESVVVELPVDTLPSPIRGESGETIELTVEGVMTPLLGTMRDFTKEDVDAWRERTRSGGEDERSRHLPGDKVGRAGIEKGYEHTLRGKRGVRILRRDTGDVEELEAQAGQDVQLTIDVMLQARVRAILEDERIGLGYAQPWHRPSQELGTKLNGAAVVLDIESGEVLAMVSSPGFTREQLEDTPDEIFHDPRRMAYINRAVQTPYPPGSVLKPVILNMACARGVHDVNRLIEDNGYLLEDDPTRLRDWFYRMTEGGSSHSALLGGPLSAEQAIARSSNVYFYTLGRDLGVDGVREGLADFGVGGGEGDSSTAGLGLPGAFGGRAADRRDGSNVVLGDAILMGIGQGPIEWTPVHAADSYATIARGGVRIWPRLVRSEPVKAKRLALEPRAVDAAVQGLWDVVHWQQGTGYQMTLEQADGGRVPEPIFTAAGVRIWGKSGTAQAAPLVYDRERFNETRMGPEEFVEGVVQGTHAWFVGYAGREGGEPKYAIAVVMEHAGSGSRVGGPIMNQIVEALKAEGYL